MTTIAGLSIILAGVFNLGFAIFHLFFGRIFRWKKDLASLHKVNWAIMHAMNLALMFIFAFFAYLLFFHSAALLSSELGRAILAGVTLFWLFRASIQLPLFGHNHSKSLVFAAFLVAGSALHAVPLFVKY